MSGRSHNNSGTLASSRSRIDLRDARAVLAQHNEQPFLEEHGRFKYFEIERRAREDDVKFPLLQEIDVVVQAVNIPGFDRHVGRSLRLTDAHAVDRLPESPPDADAQSVDVLTRRRVCRCSKEFVGGDR